jgi:hypothetical protein
MSGKGVPPVPATWFALPQNIWRGMKVAFWTGNIHFIQTLNFPSPKWGKDGIGVTTFP